MLLVAAAATWLGTRAHFTDGEFIRVDAADARVREVLWTPPERLALPASDSAEQYEPRIAWDGQTVYFTRGRAGGAADIYVAQRLPGGWTDPTPILEINTDLDELGPHPAPDGQSLYFYSDREGGFGGYDLWVTHRGESCWLPPQNLGSAVNSPYNDYGPAVAPDGLTLFFASNRPPEGVAAVASDDRWFATLREELQHRTYDLYAAPLSAAGPHAATPIAALNTPHNDGAPCVSPAGDFLYFASDRPGGEGRFDLYRARNLRDRFAPAENLGPQVNTEASELDPGLSQLGFALYFSSDRSNDESDRAAASMSASGARVASSAAVAATNPSRAASIATSTPVRRPYRLYQSNAREVYSERISREVDLLALLQSLLPWLLAVLALLILYALVGDLRDRRLNLLARCALGSLAAHALLMLLLAFWRVHAEMTRDRPAPIRVALVSAANSSSLHAQVRGDWSQAPSLAPERVEPAEWSEPVAAPVSATPFEPSLPPPTLSSSVMPSLTTPEPITPPAPAPLPNPIDAPAMPRRSLAVELELPAVSESESTPPSEPPAAPSPEDVPLARAEPTFADVPMQVAPMQTPATELPPLPGAPGRAAPARIDSEPATAALPIPAPSGWDAVEATAAPTVDFALPQPPETSVFSQDSPRPGPESDASPTPQFTQSVPRFEPASHAPGAPPPHRPQEEALDVAAPAWTPRAESLALDGIEPDYSPPALASSSAAAIEAAPLASVAAIELALPEAPAPRWTLRGMATDARDGSALSGTEVRLETPDGEPQVVRTDGDGRFEAAFSARPTELVATAALEGFVPASVALRGRQLPGRSGSLDFALQPLERDRILVEVSPRLHHLGNNLFEGRVNSRFEMPSEGRAYRIEFLVREEQLAGSPGEAVLTLLARGVQCEHPVRINGHALAAGLPTSPESGEFGEVEIGLSPELLIAGVNTLDIRSRSCWGDIDDFEFINVQIRIAR